MHSLTDFIPRSVSHGHKSETNTIALLLLLLNLINSLLILVTSQFSFVIMEFNNVVQIIASKQWIFSHKHLDDV